MIVSGISKRTESGKPEGPDVQLTKSIAINNNPLPELKNRILVCRDIFMIVGNQIISILSN